MLGTVAANMMALTTLQPPGKYLSYKSQWTTAIVLPDPNQYILNNLDHNDWLDFGIHGLAGTVRFLQINSHAEQYSNPFSVNISSVLA
jgi:hypothetical protein